MERRDFVKSSCNLCMLMAAGYVLPSLTACSPAAKVLNAEVANDTIRLTLTSFAQAATVVVRPRGWFYDIAVTKNADNTYQALLLQCTHQDNQLTQSGNGYTCSLHGSRFDNNGKALKGPASKALLQYKTSIDNNQLTIHLKA